VLRAVVVPALGLTLSTIVAGGCNRQSAGTDPSHSTQSGDNTSQIAVPGMVVQVTDTGVMPEQDAIEPLPLPGVPPQQNMPPPGMVPVPDSQRNPRIGHRVGTMARPGVVVAPGTTQPNPQRPEKPTPARADGDALSTTSPTAESPARTTRRAGQRQSVPGRAVPGIAGARPR
jgi:hypothetical protein